MCGGVEKETESSDKLNNNVKKRRKNSLLNMKRP